MLRAGHKAPGSSSQMYKLGYQEFTSLRKTLASEAFVTGNPESKRGRVLRH